MRGLQLRKLQAEQSTGRASAPTAPYLEPRPCILSPKSYVTPYVCLAHAEMAEKRKHDEPIASNQLHRPSDGSSTSPQDASGTVENYPRKRIAIAVGRLRSRIISPQISNGFQVQCLSLQEDAV
jgi:hypothetical protein